jgi:hypothetical protein
MNSDHLTVPVLTPESLSEAERPCLSPDELSEAVRVLHESGHGKDGGDYESECPACTAVEKMKTASAIRLTLDQQYWVDRRASIIQALASEGLEIWSDKDRVWLHRIAPPKDSPLSRSPTNK